MVGRIQIAASHDVFWGTHCNVRVCLLQFLPEPTTSVSGKRSQPSDEYLVGIVAPFFGMAAVERTRMLARWRAASSLFLFRIVRRKFCPGQGLKPSSSEYGEAALDPEVILGDLRGEVRLDGSFGIGLPSIRCLATSTSSTRLSLKPYCVGVLSRSPFPPRYILLKR